MYEVFFSSTFGRQFAALPADAQDRIKKALERLQDDPRRPRPGADIKKLAGTDPPKHRLRVGDYRVIYRIEGKAVKVIEVFRRGKGY